MIASGTYHNRPSTTVDEYILNVTGGIAYVWSREDRRVVDPRVGGVGLEQGLQDLVSSGPSLPEIPAAGRDTIIAYRIKRVNSSISYSLNSIDESGILFDLIVNTDYPVNGTLSHRYLVIDFYVHLECGPLNGPCNETNNTSTNHMRVGPTHFFEWKIHANLQEDVWVSDIANLRWYIENSLQRARCLDATGNDNCDLPIPEGHISGVTASTEAFGGSAGFALDYLYVLQSNDCSTHQDAGKDFNHPLRIDNVQPGQIVEVNGWLGSGYLLNDTNDYYQFNISATYLNGNSTVGVTEEGAESIWLYAPGNPPILKDHVENASRGSTGFTRVIATSDSAGYWYLQVHVSSGFGPYTFRLGLNVPPTANQPAIAAACSLGSPLPPVETSWQVIAVFGVVTALVVVLGRISTRKPWDG